MILDMFIVMLSKTQFACSYVIERFFFITNYTIKSAHVLQITTACVQCPCPLVDSLTH